MAQSKPSEVRPTATPTIQISIGRVEIRAVTRANPVPQRSAERRGAPGYRWKNICASATRAGDEQSSRCRHRHRRAAHPAARCHGLVPGANVTTTRPNGAAAIRSGDQYISLSGDSQRALIATPTCRPGAATASWSSGRSSTTLHYLSVSRRRNHLGAPALARRGGAPAPRPSVDDRSGYCPDHCQSALRYRAAGSNLADQVDVVRSRRSDYSLEELSKLWSIFFQSPYVLSVAYQASAVLIETDERRARRCRCKRAIFTSCRFAIRPSTG